MAVSFSRKPAYAAAAPAPGGSGDLRAKLMAAVSNPFIGASGAACLFLASLATLVLITSDPHAGSPVIRLELTKIGATKNAPDGWREGLGGEDPHGAELVPGQLGLSANPFAPTKPEEAEAPTAEGLQNAPPIQQGPGLAQAPIAGLTAPGPGGGPLPIIGAAARTAAEAIARPFHPNRPP